jgi:general secretion pathway protein E
MNAMLRMLAQTDSIGLNSYIGLPKVGAVLVFFVLWGLAAQWVDRDAVKVKTRREWWNIVVVGGSLSGLAVLFLVPWRGLAFFLGLSFWLVLGGGALLAFVVHRNGRVIPTARVLTPAHFQRVLQRARGNKKQKEDKGLRVKLLTEAGAGIPKPDEPEGLAEYDATQDFLFDVLWKRASDVDVTVDAEQPRVVYKIDGVITEQSGGLSLDEAERVISFLKRTTGLNPEERRRPQTGKLKAGLLDSPNKPEIVEVTTSGSTAGERLRLKVRKASALLKPEELGFSEECLAKFKKLVAVDTGLVVFAGPRESGLTTTQYATLRGHDAYLQNIYTLETAPLLKLDNMTQQVFDPAKADATYARALQTVLRREPDVVMVSECKDRESAEIACRAGAEKKIYLALEATNAFDALARLLALVEDPRLVAQSLAGIISQRLLRMLCPACREAYKPDEQLLRKANLPVDKIENFYRPPSQPILDKKGREIICQRCQGSRYVGRIGVFEVLEISDAIRALISAGKPLKDIKDQARKAKMLYLQEDGLRKVIDGTTSMNEVMRGLRMDGK